MTNRNRPQTKEEMLYLAAQCYQRAHRDQDVLRVYEVLQDYQQIAQQHERQGRWEIAGRYYERVSEWSSAARCYERANMRYEQAEALFRANTPIPAAWLWAHFVHDFHRALATIEEVDTSELLSQLRVELIRARCEAGSGDARAAVKRLRNAASRFHEPALRSQLHGILTQAQAVAQAMNRYDVQQELFAAYFQAGGYHSLDEWTNWADSNLGSADFSALLSPPDNIAAVERPTAASESDQ